MQHLFQRFPWLVQVPRATIDQLARRPWLSVSIVLVMVLFSAGTSLVSVQATRDSHAPPPPPPPRHHQPPAVIATLEKTSLGLETVDGWAKTVLLDERTTIWLGREPARWEDLRVGQRVHVRDERLPGGKYVAREIHIAPPGPPPPPPGGRLGGIVLLLALAMALVWKWNRTRNQPPTPPPSTGGDPEHVSS